jgi:hypothetical protein
MTKRTKLIIGGLTVAIALAAAVNTAAARRFEVSEQRFLVLFRELTFTGSGGVINPTVICPVNIEGSFHSRTISKVSGQLIGYITEAIVHHRCIENEAWALNGTEVAQGATVPNTLPWHILYLGFRGTLPRIVEIEVTIDNGKFIVEAAGVLCLYAATTGHPMEGQIHLNETGRVTVLRASEEQPIPFFEGSGFCPPNGTLRGEGTVGTQSTWREITVRLVQ